LESDVRQNNVEQRVNCNVFQTANPAKSVFRDDVNES
jgi:hypothetical protein